MLKTDGEDSPLLDREDGDENSEKPEDEIMAEESLKPEISTRQAVHPSLGFLGFYLIQATRVSMRALRSYLFCYCHNHKSISLRARDGNKHRKLGCKITRLSEQVDKELYVEWLGQVKQFDSAAVFAALDVEEPTSPIALEISNMHDSIKQIGYSANLFLTKNEVLSGSENGVYLVKVNSKMFDQSTGKYARDAIFDIRQSKALEMVNSWQKSNQTKKKGQKGIKKKTE